MGFGERLKDERKRLKLSAERFGDLLGVSGNTQYNYEKEDRSPDVSYLSEAAKLGCDVVYLITGLRSIASLSQAHQDLLSAYDSAGPEYQRSAISVLLTGAGQKSTDRDIRPLGVQDHDFEEIGHALADVLGISANELSIALTNARVAIAPHMKTIERRGVTSGGAWETIKQVLYRELGLALQPYVDRYVRTQSSVTASADADIAALLQNLPDQVRTWLICALKASPTETRSSPKVRGPVGQFVEGGASFSGPVEFSPGKVVKGKKG